MKQLRIFHFAESIDFAAGGVTRAVVDLVLAQSRQGHDVTLVLQESKDDPFAQKDRPTLEQPCPRVLIDDAPDAVSLAECDVAHLHAVWSPWLAKKAKELHRQGVPYVVSTHGMLDDWPMRQKWLKKRIYLQTLGKNYLGRARCVLFTSQAEAEQAGPRLPNGLPHRVVPLVVDLADYLMLERADQQPPIVLFLSRIAHNKGVETLIRASLLLKTRGVQHVLLIAGTGSENFVEQMKSLTKQLGLDTTTRFIGHVGGQMKLEALASAAVFALPTQQENFCIAIVEAMAAGVPVVTTRNVGIWRDIERAGAVLCDQSPEAFADSIGHLLSNSEDRLSRVERGRQWTRTALDATSVTQQYLSIYESVIRAPLTSQTS